MTINLASNYPVQKQFRESKAKIRVIMGCIGSGKSHTCCQEILSIMMRQAPDKNGVRKSRIAFVKHTKTSIPSTMLDNWYQFLGKKARNYMKFNNKGNYYDFEMKKSKIKARIYFIGLGMIRDDEDLKGLRLTAAWINEAVYIRHYKLVEILEGRLGRYPTDNKKGYLVVDTNPPHTDHWVCKNIDMRDDEDYKVFKQPSGMSEEAENRHILAILYGSHWNYYEEKMKNWSRYRVQTDIHGQYGLNVEGDPVYPEFDEREMVIDHDEMIKIVQDCCRYDDVEFCYGMDFGSTPAMVIAMKNKSEQKWYVFDEMVTPSETKIGCDEFLGLVKEKLIHLSMKVDRDISINIKGHGDPSGDAFDQIQGDDTLFEIGRKKYGLDLKPAYKNNNLVIRRETLRDVVRNKKILFSNKCKNTVEGMAGGFHYRLIESAMAFGEEKRKVVKNKYSHPIESLEYLLVGEKQNTISINNRHEIDKSSAYYQRYGHYYDKL